MISTPSLFLGGPELEQQRIAGQCLLFQLVEASPEDFQAPASHRAFFEGSGMTSREDVELLVMRQEFDVDRRGVRLAKADSGTSFSNFDSRPLGVPTK